MCWHENYDWLRLQSVDWRLKPLYYPHTSFSKLVSTNSVSITLMTTHCIERLFPLKTEELFNLWSRFLKTPRRTAVKENMEKVYVKATRILLDIVSDNWKKGKSNWLKKQRYSLCFHPKYPKIVENRKNAGRWLRNFFLGYIMDFVFKYIYPIWNLTRITNLWIVLITAQ